MTMADDGVELEADLLAYVEDKFGPLAQDEEETGEEEVEGEPEVEEEDEEEDGGDDDGEDESEPPVAPEAAPQTDDDVIEVEPGVTLTRGQAKSYKQFEAILSGDPELYKLLEERIHNPPAGAPSTHAPAGGAPALPEIDESDLEDPTIKALYDAAQQQRESLAAAEQRIRELSDVTFNREAEEVTHILNVKKEEFATTHHLTPDEMDRVAAVAGRLNVVPGLLQGIDPLTGATAPRDRGQAFARAFEIAYYFDPTFREREIETAVADRAKSTRRKQKLAGISGSSGSVPKGVPIVNAQDRRAAMIAEVAGMMGQSTETE
jgi:hypothetical protein